MFVIPISKETLPFCAPLDIAGSIQLQLPDEALSRLRTNEAFSSQTAFGPDKVIGVGFQLDGHGSFKLGPVGGIALSLNTGAAATLDLVWPGEDPAPLVPYGLTVASDQLYLVLTCSGQAAVGASAMQQFPSYALSAAFGLKTGANIQFAYLKPFNQNTGSADILKQLFKGLRLPYNVTSVEDLPEAGEVLALQYGGYLSLQTQAAWGYTLERFDEHKLGNLQLRQKIEISSALSLSASFKIAGQFGIELWRGSEDGWARVVVRKNRSQAFTAAADLDVNVVPQVEGLPEDASQFLEALLGLDLPDHIDQAAAAIKLKPEELEKWLGEKADGLTERLFRTLFQKWFPDQAIRARAEPFIDILRSVLDRYEQLRQSDEHLIQIASSFTAEQLERVRSLLANLQARTDLQSITDSVFWRLIRTLLPDRYFEFLTDEKVFVELSAEIETKLAKLLEDEGLKLLEFIGVSRAVSRLDELVAELRTFDTAEELKSRAERHILDLAHRLTDRAFDALSGKNLQEAFGELQQVLLQIDALKTTVYDRFRESLNQSYKFGLSRRYSRATEKEALIDVEINLNSEKGRSFLTQALHRDFTSVLNAASLADVRLRTGVLTHRKQVENQLTVTLFGWEYSRFHEFALNAKELLVPHGDGLLHVYELEAREQDRRRKRGEEIRLSFVLGLMAEGHQAERARPDLVDVVSRMSCDYAWQIADPKTTDRELVSYLDLAQHLGLLPPFQLPEDFVGQIRSEIEAVPGKPLGAVSISYQVRYEPDALLNIFHTFKENRIQAIARQAFRRMVSAIYARFGERNVTTSERSALGLSRAILCGAMHELWRKEGLQTNNPGPIVFTIPCGSSRPVVAEIDKHRRLVLDALYATEEKFVKALGEMDQIIEQAGGDDKPDRKRLEDVFETFARQREAVEKFMIPEERARFVNPFFSILDQLIAASQHAGMDHQEQRKSTMELNVRQGEKTITKILVS